jgi:hypothetical protein
MTCAHCGFVTTEPEAMFCPNCGQPLGEGQPSPRPVPIGLPSDPIYHAPTRISSGAVQSEPPVGWGSALPTPPSTPTNSRLYSPAIPTTPPGTPPLLAPLPAAPAAPKRKPAFTLLALLALVVVFVGGVGVGAALFGARGRLSFGAAATATLAPSSTPTLAPSPTATPRETPIFQDALTGPVNPWPVDGTHCQFQGGSYHVLRNFICFAPVGVQSDVAISVQVKQISGAGTLFYGLAFRYGDAKDFYLFRINSNSTWLFGKETNGVETNITPDTTNSAIKSGLNVVNTVLVRVKSAHFDFFVNGTNVGEANDASLSAGTLGLIGANSADVAFTNMQIATLS